jgi:outer membrane protein assembly factor BamD
LRNTKIYLLLLVVVFTFSGCGLWKHPDMAKATPESLYKIGKEAYHAGRYQKAIDSFQKLKEEYPLHQMALLAELGIADSNFSNEDYMEAELSYNDFINLHPTNENLPYAMYQLGMCHYKQITTLDRDQSETRKARKEFERVIARFPDNKFSFMAENMLRKCKQMLAENEFYVGNFYFKRKLYKAALRRFEGITKDYANMGLDYKVGYLIDQTKKRMDEEKAVNPSSKTKK